MAELTVLSLRVVRKRARPVHQRLSHCPDANLQFPVWDLRDIVDGFPKRENPASHVQTDPMTPSRFVFSGDTSPKDTRKLLVKVMTEGSGVSQSSVEKSDLQD